MLHYAELIWAHNELASFYSKTLDVLDCLLSAGCVGLGIKEGIDSS